MQALRDMDSAIELMPEVSYLYYDRANIYYIRNDFRSAIEDYSRAIRLNPNLAEAYYNRGLTRILNGDRNLGIADLQKAGDLGLYSAYGVISRRK
jgi:tetratricopeptide (TPR) repeat protein